MFNHHFLRCALFNRNHYGEQKPNHNKNPIIWADTPCTTFRYCELAAEQKMPVQNGWQTNTKSFDEVWDAHQADRSNIGLVLGNTSGVMDIDFDRCEAVALMPSLNSTYLLFARHLRLLFWKGQCWL